MTKQTLTGEIRLDCQHHLHFDIAIPVKGETLWCRRCQKMRIVEYRYRGRNYRIRCKKCNYGRAFGEGRLKAELAIVAHRNKLGRDHLMVLTDQDRNVLKSFGRDGETEEPLPGLGELGGAEVAPPAGDDPPPF